MARRFQPPLGQARGYVTLLDAVALRIPGHGSDESLNDLLPEASLLLLALTGVKLPRKEPT
ncbi:hypothetical protein IEN85_09780 [Pelagicoccus sp. NFK12]|uniref:Uncharacterized protein n=1 Tax=Pelagicoccus enzymogenes TaxID=2773457 RepID=A0A927F9M7_9BACT|nr:hypothetical protein [Pelagicoccus enzymogenes]MBD5779781.1 hypothetical protein [Pelagicoccus enzymogenes]